jgi:stage V sporulation protein S
MNRFFSKLDLRDIKISPEGSRFPPDADEQESQSQAAIAEQVEQATGDHEATTWESPVYSNGHRGLEEAKAETSGSDVVPSLPEEAVRVPELTRAISSSYGVEGVVLADDGEVLKVSARSRPSAVAGAIAGVVREAGRAEVQAIGAGATNQAIKAVAIAREYLRETGIDAVCVPAFIDVTIENEDRTAIRLVIEPR